MRKTTIKQNKLSGFNYSVKEGDRTGFIIFSQKCGMDKMDGEDYIEINKETIPKLIKLLKTFAKKGKQDGK